MGGDRRRGRRRRSGQLRHRQRCDRELRRRFDRLDAGGDDDAECRPAPSGRPWGHQRSDETLLTGDSLSKVTAAAQAKVPAGTIVRVETDADGNAAYEAHMTNAAGEPVTVYVDKSFDVVSVETR